MASTQLRMARNKNTMEVCASIPAAPMALVGIMGMGAGAFALLHLAKGLNQEKASSPLPMGGKALWMAGPALTMLTIGALLSTCGPARPPVLRNLQDMSVFETSSRLGGLERAVRKAGALGERAPLQRCQRILRPPDGFSSCERPEATVGRSRNIARVEAMATRSWLSGGSAQVMGRAA